MVFPEETSFFRRFLPQAEGLDLEGQLRLAEKLLIHIFLWNQVNPPPVQDGFPDRDYSAIPYEQVRLAMREYASQSHRNAGDILSAAILAYGQVSGQAGVQSRWWVEKTPYNEYFVGRIFEWWPEARCIHILRDPRDNFASYSRKHPDWSPEFFASNWVRSTKAGLDNCTRYGPERYLLIRYEDITHAPQEQLMKLSSYLGIDWDASLAAPTRAGEQWRGNSMFTDQFQEISAVPVSRWKEKLSPIDAGVIEQKAGSLMASFGYDCEALASGGMSRRLAARWRWLVWPVRRRLRSRAKSQPE